MEGTPVKQQEQPSSSVALIRSVTDIAINHRMQIDEKLTKATAVIRQVKGKIKSIETEQQDKYVNDLIVMSNNALSDCEKLRKAYTGKVNDWIKGEIAPENAFKVEIGELTEMRNARAKRLTAEADKKKAAIDAENKKKQHEIEVKRRMKISFEEGLFNRLQEYNKSLGSWFMSAVKADNGPTCEKALKGNKPFLKEDVYLDLFIVDFDSAIMPQGEFDELVKRAKTFWVYEDLNKKYTAEAEAVRDSWIAKIPQRVKELEIIAKGGAEAERVKKIVSEREAAEASDKVKEAAAKVDENIRKINEEAQGDAMTAEFTAQVQTQAIEKPSGTRNSKYYILDNPMDLVTLSKIIGGIIMHLIPDDKADRKRKAIFAHDKTGNFKRDAEGNPIYSDGVQFWLDIAASLDYKVELPGLTQKTKVSTVARASE